MKAAFIDLEKWQRDYVSEKLGKAFEEVTFLKKLTKKNIEKIKNYEILACFIFSKLDKKILNKFPKLKLITTMSTGFDHIDLEECKRRKITVCNVPAYGANTVAEHALALMLSLIKKIPQSHERTVKGNFLRDGLRTSDMKGKIIGVIGVGSIGRHFIQMCCGMEMKIIAFDVKKDEKLAKKLGFKYVSLSTLLKNSDIISLHAPLNNNTRHMIDLDAIKKMKKGVYIINTARGALIDTKALLWGIKKKIVAGAALDVLEEECHITEDLEVLSSQFPKICDTQVLWENHVLAKQENVLITPHNAFNSWEALKRILDTTINNIKAFRKGKKVNVIV